MSDEFDRVGRRASIISLCQIKGPSLTFLDRVNASFPHLRNVKKDLGLFVVA